MRTTAFHRFGLRIYRTAKRRNSRSVKLVLRVRTGLRLEMTLPMFEEWEHRRPSGWPRRMVVSRERLLKAGAIQTGRGMVNGWFSSASMTYGRPTLMAAISGELKEYRPRICCLKIVILHFHRTGL